MFKLLTGLSPQARLLLNGFIGGTVTTLSICYAVFDMKSSVLQARTEFSAPSLFPYGVPRDNRRYIEYSGHSLYYDAAKKQPLWVAQVLSKESLKGGASRKNSQFKRDDKIPLSHSADNSDYQKSGWSRGHMAPAGDYKHSQNAMDDTFYLTNIVPQDSDNNSGFWNRLESHCRDLLKTFDRLHVITGPLYKYNKEIGNKKLVEYEMIGRNLVPVPTHLYKVILASKEGKNSQPYIAAFIVPNKPITRETDELMYYQVEISELESLTGFTFHPMLDKKTLKNLCTAESGACKLKNWKEFELYSITQSIKNARSSKDIEKAMVQLKKYDIQPSKSLLEIIEEKNKQFANNQNRNAQKA